MTECERLIKEGSFAPDFFKEEVRCDFLVTTERKKLWAVQLDLYRQLAEVCERHHLKYFALGGTILGAVRHKGFIPWDDDIDIAMPRNDYQRLLSLGDEFRSPYFLQIPGQDEEYFFSYTKVRNSFTTQVSKPFRHRHFNQGVQIDVFPMDLWDYEAGRMSYERMNTLNCDNSNWMRQGHPSPDADMLRRMSEWSGRSACENLMEIESTARQFEKSLVADRLTCSLCTIYPYDRFVFRKEWFNRMETVEFEGQTMVIPSCYDEILTMQFGDWHAFPPVEKRGAWHANEIFDADKHYTEYLI